LRALDANVGQALSDVLVSDLPHAEALPSDVAEVAPA